MLKPFGHLLGLYASGTIDDRSSILRHPFFQHFKHPCLLFRGIDHLNFENEVGPFSSTIVGFQFLTQLCLEMLKNLFNNIPLRCGGEASHRWMFDMLAFCQFANEARSVKVVRSEGMPPTG
jgi:hypothetical protein